MRQKKEWGQELYDAADEYFAAERDEAVDGLSACIAEGCESPIERLLLSRLVFIRVYGSAPAVGSTEMAPDLHNRTKASPDVAFLLMQWPVLEYRADACLCFRDYLGELVYIVIECDGHDYHERTKKQAARDRSRDREMMTAGYYVMRFTGAEIYADPAKCARQVEAMAARIIQDSARRLNG